MGNNHSAPVGAASDPPPELPKWRRVLSIALLCAALALLLPIIILGCTLAYRHNSADSASPIGLSVIVAYPAIILLAVAAVIRWHRNPPSRNVPGSRRFQFSLRTLFVVITILACWLGYEFNWIRQRHEFISRRPELAKPHQTHKAYKYRPVEAPGLLWVFGEPGASYLWFESKPSESEIARAKRLFPEAKLQSAY
jgi:hypothetical protein